jgi:hypothetical protein
MVERFFRDLTVNRLRRGTRLRRGVFHSVPELVAALEKYMAQHNREPKPFIWTAKANDILAKVARAQKKPCLSACLTQREEQTLRKTGRLGKSARNSSFPASFPAFLPS